MSIEYACITEVDRGKGFIVLAMSHFLNRHHRAQRRCLFIDVTGSCELMHGRLMELYILAAEVRDIVLVICAHR